MQSYVNGLTSRSSSASLFLARPRFYPTDGALDDMDIAQELLNHPPRIPARNSSFSPSKRFDFSTGHLDENATRKPTHSSITWISSSGEVMSDYDDVDERTELREEYNCFAKKHGVRLLFPDDDEMVPENDETVNEDESIKTNGKHGNWFTRNILRRSSSGLDIQSSNTKNELLLKQQRSISDISIRGKQAKDTFKGKDLQELVRLCGLSSFDLPEEFAPRSFAVPTCFRATGQYLVENGLGAIGVFRIPGSHNTVNFLYNHYCTTSDDENLIGTVRCATLPDLKKIRYDINDIASTFKKFLYGLPGGILGSLSLFDALLTIQNQLLGGLKLTETKETEIPTRLIALAIGTTRSQYRRDIICTVFGLLSMIGSATEEARSKYDSGRPPPTDKLMDYHGLGNVFGPLLVGEMLDQYKIHTAVPSQGPALPPAHSPRSRKEKLKKNKTMIEGAHLSPFNKVTVASGVVKMLITHWRDVVRHMKDTGAVESNIRSTTQGNMRVLRSSASESFILQRSLDFNRNDPSVGPNYRDGSPTPIPRHTSHSNLRSTSYSHGHHEFSSGSSSDSQSRVDDLKVRKRRERSKAISSKKPLSVLSPTAEEPSYENEVYQNDISITPSREHVMSSAEAGSRRNSPMTPNYVSKSLLDRKPLPKLPVDDSELPAPTTADFANKIAMQEARFKQQNKIIVDTSNTNENYPGGIPVTPKPQQVAPSNTKLGRAANFQRSPHAATPKWQASNDTRCIGGSEPGLRPGQVLRKPDRELISKTHDPSQTSQLLANPDSMSSTTQYPPARVSHEEDRTSLEELAGAIGRANKTTEADTNAGLGGDGSPSVVAAGYRGNRPTPQTTSLFGCQNNGYSIDSYNSNNSFDSQRNKYSSSCNKREEKRAVASAGMQRQQTSEHDTQEFPLDIQDNTRLRGRDNIKNFTSPGGMDGQNSLEYHRRDSNARLYDQDDWHNARHARIEESRPRPTIASRYDFQDYQSQETNSIQPRNEQGGQISIPMPRTYTHVRQKSSISTSYSSASSIVTGALSEGTSQALSEGTSHLPTTYIISSSTRVNDRDIIERSGSVKALAAKFDNSDSSVVPLSPMKSLPQSTTRMRGLSTYTQNPSPAPSPTRSQNSVRSGESRKPARSPTSTQAKNSTIQISAPFHNLDTHYGGGDLESRAHDQASGTNRVPEASSALRGFHEHTSHYNLNRYQDAEDVLSSGDDPSQYHLLDDHQDDSPTRAGGTRSTLQRFHNPREYSSLLRNVDHGRTSADENGFLQKELWQKQNTIENLKKEIEILTNRVAALNVELSESRREANFWKQKAQSSENGMNSIDSRKANNSTHFRSATSSAPPELAAPSNDFGVNGLMMNKGSGKISEQRAFRTNQHPPASTHSNQANSSASDDTWAEYDDEIF